MVRERSGRRRRRRPAATATDDDAQCDITLRDVIAPGPAEREIVVRARDAEDGSDADERGGAPVGIQRDAALRRRADHAGQFAVAATRNT